MLRPLLLPGVVLVLGILALGGWGMRYRQAPVLPPRLPEIPTVPDFNGRTMARPAAVDLRGELRCGPGRPGSASGSWPAFRGPARDNRVVGGPPLLRSLSSAGPSRLWSIPVGDGYAAPVVEDGMVFLLDHEPTAKRDVLRCLSLDDGAEIWARSYAVEIRRNHGYSRSIPAVAEGLVVSIGPKGQVLCCEAATGEFRWGIDLAATFGAVPPDWYAAQCPLIDQGRVILAPGGPEALLLAVELTSGRELWRTPNPRGWLMTHASVMPMVAAGRRMYVYPASNPRRGSGGVVGVDAEDGRELWASEAFGPKIVAPSPLPLPGGRLLCCAGYQADAVLLRLEVVGDGLQAVEERCWKEAEFGAEQQTPINDGVLTYAVVPDGRLVCLDAGWNRLWDSGRDRFGLGPFLLADGRLWLLDDHGQLTVAEAGAGGWRPLGRTRILEGEESWGPLALAGTRLLARDLKRLVCLELAP